MILVFNTPKMITDRHLSLSNTLLDIGLYMPGVGRSFLLWIIGKRSKMGYPYSTALLRHYVGGSGDPYDLNQMGPIPEAWQRWIVKSTGAKFGRHLLNPYNASPPIPDLKNSLGHFDVVVSERADSRVKIYDIEKIPYHFGFKPHDVHQAGRHGFELPAMSSNEIREIRGWLPTRRYRNPGGFVETFEIKLVRGKWTIYVPQKVAAQAGRPFNVYGRFFH